MGCMAGLLQGSASGIEYERRRYTNLVGDKPVREALPRTHAWLQTALQQASRLHCCDSHVTAGLCMHVLVPYLVYLVWHDSSCACGVHQCMKVEMAYAHMALSRTVGDTATCSSLLSWHLLPIMGLLALAFILKSLTSDTSDRHDAASQVGGSLSRGSDPLSPALIQGMLSLIQHTSALSPADAPETLLLDCAQLVSLQNELQRLSLVAAALLIAQQLLSAKGQPTAPASPDNAR